MDLTKNKIEATLVIPIRSSGDEREIFLARKTRKIAVGLYNGFGGSVDGETPRKGATRELKEELNIVAEEKDLIFVGVMTFHNQRTDGSKFTVRVYIFLLEKWRGEPKLKKDEMRDPKWFNIKKLPFKEMPHADIFWLPTVLDGYKIKGQAWYGHNQKTLLKTPDIKVVKYLSDVD